MMVSFTRFARAASPSTERGTEKGHMDKRFSALFTLSAQPQDSAPAPADGQNEKSSAKSDIESSAETDTESTMNPASQPTRVKPDRRFSTFFMSSEPSSPPAPAPSHDETAGQLSAPKASLPQMRNLKLLFRRMFSSGPRDETKAPPLTSGDLGSRLWSDLMGDSSGGTTVAPPSRATRQRSQTTVVVLPALWNSPGRSRSRGGVEVVGILQSSGKKRPDSKFSSITSLPSLQSLSLPTSNSSSEGGTINISPSGLLFLESCIRRIERGLAHQEYLASHLSNNLIFLFTKKEKQLQMLRRLRPDERHALTTSLSRLKDATGKTFLRKAVFLQRSCELTCQIKDILKKARANLSQTSTSFEGASPLIAVEDRILDLLRVLGTDVCTQRDLDRALAKAVLGAAKERKWSAGGEPALLGKFCCFVEARLGVLEGVYGRVEMWVGRMERVERGV